MPSSLPCDLGCGKTIFEFSELPGLFRHRRSEWNHRGPKRPIPLSEPPLGHERLDLFARGHRGRFQRGQEELPGRVEALAIPGRMEREREYGRRCRRRRAL